MYCQSQLLHSALTADFILINKKKSGEKVMGQLLKQVVETWMSDCQVTRHLIQKVWARNNFVLVTLSTTHPTPSPTYHPNCVVPRLQPNFLAKVNNQLIFATLYCLTFSCIQCLDNNCKRKILSKRNSLFRKDV